MELSHVDGFPDACVSVSFEGRNWYVCYEWRSRIFTPIHLFILVLVLGNIALGILYRRHPALSTFFHLETSRKRVKTHGPVTRDRQFSLLRLRLESDRRSYRYAFAIIVRIFHCVQKNTNFHGHSHRYVDVRNSFWADRRSKLISRAESTGIIGWLKPKIRNFSSIEGCKMELISRESRNAENKVYEALSLSLDRLFRSVWEPNLKSAGKTFRTNHWA